MYTFASSPLPYRPAHNFNTIYMKPTKAKLRMIKEARKIERELQISLGMNFNRHRVHESKKSYNRKTLKINDKKFVD